MNGSTGVVADAPVEVTFDQPVRADSVRTRFHVDPPLSGCDPQAAFSAGSGARCRVVWSDGGAAFTLLHPGALFTPDTKYTLSLSPGVVSTAGTENSLDHHWNVTSGPAPRVTSVVPADGSTQVPVDAPMVVSFSSDMDARRTAAAIRLVPAVPGTRVVQNLHSRGRFVILPGSLLTPGATYTLAVSRQARDLHGQPIDVAVAATFTAGGFGSAGHGLVLARAAGEGPSQVLLTGLGALQDGEPAYAATVMGVARCSEPRCGPVAHRAPIEEVLQAALAPDNHHVAVVVRDLTSATVSDSLELVDLPSGTRHLLATGADFAAWSPDGRTLAYGAADGIHLRMPATGTDSLLPPGDPLDAPPVWSSDGSTLALPVRAPAGAPHVDLADPVLLVRYPVPGVTGAATDPALTADGSELALRRDGQGADADGTWVIDLRGGTAPGRQLGSDLTPVAWADAGTLLAVQRPQDGTPGIVRVTVADGDRTLLDAGPAASDLSTVVASPDGRQLGYLLVDAAGVRQAYIENADGTNPAPLTTFRSGGLEAYAVSFAR